MDIVKKTHSSVAMGNSYALKWTEEKVNEKISLMESRLKEEPAKFNFLGTILVDLGLYAGIWAHWKKKFKDNESITNRMKVIDSFFEAKIVEGGITGKLNPTLVIFSLKNNHGWKDKKEIDLSGGLSIGNMNDFIDDED